MFRRVSQHQRGEVEEGQGQQRELESGKRGDVGTLGQQWRCICVGLHKDTHPWHLPSVRVWEGGLKCKAK